MNERFYQVGGSVRDKILGVESKDIDYAVEAASFDEMRQAILMLGGRIFLETPKFLTIRANIPNLGACDYVLCRKDGAYSDGRHPDNVVVGTIADDLARRDFTMNAIAFGAYNVSGWLDPFDGMGDIKRKVIKCVGNPLERFTEDKLRVFRALRFAITKGFAIDTDTSIAMDAITDYSSVSTERIREELLKMFKHDTLKSIESLQSYPLLWRVIQERGIWFKPTTEGT